MNDKDKPVIECIREFKLRQQYPSMIKKSKNGEKTVVINGSLKSLIPVNTRFKTKMNTQAKSGFHKFRLKLASGKDLGECNVRILPDNNILKGKTVTIINQNKCKSFNKPIILLSTMSKNETKNMVGNIPLQSMNSTGQRNVAASPNAEYSHKVASNIRNKRIDAKDNNVKYQPQSIFVKYGINDQSYEATKNKGIENMDIDVIRDEGCNNKELPAVVLKNGKCEIRNIQRILENNKKSTNENSLLALSDYLTFSRPVKMVNNPLVQLTKVPNHSVRTSGAIVKTVENNSNIVNSDSQNDHRFDAKKELYLSSRGDGNINLSLEPKPNNIDLITKDKSIDKNVMIIVDDNETSSLDNGVKTIHGMSNELISNTNHNTSNNNISTAASTSSYENLKFPNVLPNTFVLNENQCNIEQNTEKPSKGNPVDENASLKRTRCSVLKEVMSTIRKEKLKAKELEASTDRAIEMEHLLSIPKDTRAVPNTEMQTEMYSLLKPENVLNVKEDTSSIIEITPKELYASNIPDNLNLNSLHYMPFYKNFTFSPFNQLQKSDRLLDKSIDYNVINDICNKHSTAYKVKEVLSQPSVLCNKIFEQLQKDFDTVKQWDEDGMLNIHKAVISNRIHDIQRHLMVLKACNINVDVPTQSGMTSLELAIKYNASTEIVKLLLEAGANPSSFQPVHESALIIASKISSSLLPLLLNHVPSNGLLDHVDFTGFTALHYCAQYGNMEGVTSLINMGANVNLQESRSGRTPLFLAVENNHPVIAENLIEKGALPDIPNFAGKTVMSLVESIKQLSLVTLLHTMDR